MGLLNLWSREYWYQIKALATHPANFFHPFIYIKSQACVCKCFIFFTLQWGLRNRLLWIHVHPNPKEKKVLSLLPCVSFSWGSMLHEGRTQCRSQRGGSVQPCLCLILTWCSGHCLASLSIPHPRPCPFAQALRVLVSEHTTRSWLLGWDLPQSICCN